MILSNRELYNALDAGRIKIHPEPQPRLPSGDQDGHSPYDTHSVDLTLSDEIVIPKQGAFTYDLTQPGGLAGFISANSERKKSESEMPYRLKPMQFVLGNTIERVTLPIDETKNTCLAARIEGKSSRARCGILVHFTAPTVHPGFDGHLTLEIINLGASNFLLVPGMTIAQLIVEEVKGIPFANPSQFQGQSTPAGSG